MRITQFTDYSLRVLIYLGLKEETATVAEISKAFNISGHHLVKVVHQLSQDGIIKSFKGRGGGIELAIPPEQIRIGDFIRSREPLDLLECFNQEFNTCPIQGTCQLERSLYEARNAFLESLNRHTLQDYLANSPAKKERMRRLGLQKAG